MPVEEARYIIIDDVFCTQGRVCSGIDPNLCTLYLTFEDTHSFLL